VAQDTTETDGRLAPIRALLQAARDAAPGLGARLLAALPGLSRGGADAVPARDRPPVAGTSGVPTAASGEVAAVWQDEILVALHSAEAGRVSLDGHPPVPMRRLGDTSLSYALLPLTSASPTHRYRLFAGGRDVGSGEVAAYGPLSYEQPGVARGALSGPFTLTSRIYPGASVEFWIYANAGVDPARPAPLMVWQDGARYVGAADLVNYRLQIVTDNLVAAGRMPPALHVLAAPATGGEPLPPRFAGDTQATQMRSRQYDSFSPRYGEHVLGELLPAVERRFRLRTDAYSRAAAGLSSGGVCAFTLAWFHNDAFSRVHSNIGSFTALQWHPGRHEEGGNLVADWVRRAPRRNIRVWMSDGACDMEVDSDDRPDLFAAGSWPLHNIAMANALKLRGYDFHFRFGEGLHSTAQGAHDLPDSLAWLWRDYDPARDAQSYEQEPAEQAKPIFRVRIAGRDAW